MKSWKGWRGQRGVSLESLFEQESLGGSIAGESNKAESSK